MNTDPFIRDFVTLNKAVINYLPRCSYHLLYKTEKPKFLIISPTLLKNGERETLMPYRSNDTSDIPFETYSKKMKDKQLA